MCGLGRALHVERAAVHVVDAQHQLRYLIYYHSILLFGKASSNVRCLGSCVSPAVTCHK